MVEGTCCYMESIGNIDYNRSTTYLHTILCSVKFHHQPQAPKSSKNLEKKKKNIITSPDTEISWSIPAHTCLLKHQHVVNKTPAMKPPVRFKDPYLTSEQCWRTKPSPRFDIANFFPVDFFVVACPSYS